MSITCGLNSRTARTSGAVASATGVSAKQPSGNGGSGYVLVSKPYINKQGNVSDLREVIPGSGILATSFPQLVYGEKSGEIGNITVETPEGNIVASSGGIVQLSMNVERPLELPLASIVDAVRAHPLIREWYDAAAKEPVDWLVEDYERTPAKSSA